VLHITLSQNKCQRFLFARGSRIVEIRADANVRGPLVATSDADKSIGGVMSLRKICVAISIAAAITGCSKGAEEQHDSATHAAGDSSARYAPSLTSPSARTTAGTDSVGRSPIDTARVGRDTGRQSQAPAPNKQP
jgi:hypothetical protein